MDPSLFQKPLQFAIENKNTLATLFGGTGSVLAFQAILGPYAPFLNSNFSTYLLNGIVLGMVFRKPVKAFLTNSIDIVAPPFKNLFANSGYDDPMDTGEIFEEKSGIGRALAYAAIFLVIATSMVYGNPISGSINYLARLASMENTTVTATLSSIIIFFLGFFALSKTRALEVERVVALGCIAASNFISERIISPWFFPPAPKVRAYLGPGGYLDLNNLKVEIKNDSNFDFLFVAYNFIIKSMVNLPYSFFNGVISFTSFIFGAAGSMLPSVDNVTHYMTKMMIGMKDAAVGLIEIMQKTVVGSSAYQAAAKKLQEYLTVSDTWFSTNTPTMYNILAYMKTITVMIGNWMNDKLTVLLGVTAASYLLTPFTFLSVTFGTVYLIYKFYKSRNQPPADVQELVLNPKILSSPAQLVNKGPKKPRAPRASPRQVDD
jgi:hypothetical protein